MELELELDPDHEPKPDSTQTKAKANVPAPQKASAAEKSAEPEKSARREPPEPVKFDRRRSDRPAAPRPGVMLSLQLKTDKIAKIIFATTSRGMMFVGAQLICLAIIAWSLGVRYTGLESTDVMEHEMLTLQTKLDILKSQWSEEDLRMIEANLTSAESRVFDDYTSFAAWLREKTDYASRLGLDMSYNIGQRDKTSLTGTLSLPVHMSLKVNENTADNTYVRALEFVRSLIDENLRLEVFGNGIKADRDGINSVDLSIHVWVRADDAIDNSVGPDSEAEVSDVAFIQ